MEDIKRMNERKYLEVKDIIPEMKISLIGLKEIGRAHV